MGDLKDKVALCYNQFCREQGNPPNRVSIPKEFYFGLNTVEVNSELFLEFEEVDLKIISYSDLPKNVQRSVMGSKIRDPLVLVKRRLFRKSLFGTYNLRASCSELSMI